MTTIEIDDDVLVHLQAHAKPFVDTPNGTLRRLLGILAHDLSNTQTSPSNVAKTKIGDLPSQGVAGRTKAQKASLRILAEMGLLREGQKLHLVNYQKNKVRDHYAAIKGGDLDFNGERYSMSKLAKELLQKEGFKSEDIRGPSHWSTVDGKTVTELWQQVLRDRI